MAPLRKVILYVLALVMAAACFLPIPDGDDQGAPSQPAPGQQEDGSMTVEEFESDINTAVALAEEYWDQQFRNSRLQFSPVRRVVAYLDDGDLSCGSQGIPGNNAVYCPGGDFIAYDADWAVAAFRQIGDAFIYFLLGHEYAHAIQARLDVSHQFTIEHELQADCMAGAYLGDSVRAQRLQLDVGDLDEFERGLVAVGDDPGQPWFAEDSHGTPQQRLNAFSNGYDNSLEACDI